MRRTSIPTVTRTNLLAKARHMLERERIAKLLTELDRKPILRFPPAGVPLRASKNQGVYVIRSPRTIVVHVGRTVRGKSGLQQRLRNHLAAQSSFVQASLSSKGASLRDGYTYQCIDVPNDRARALLEHIATAWHCPKHLGVGAKAERTSSNPGHGKK